MEALTDELDVAEAYRAFADRITQGGEPIERQVGYRAGIERVTLIWHSNERLWVLLEPERLPNRYWCAFGIDDPQVLSLLSITCEINSPRSGINRQCAGLFIRDDNGSIYLAHSGKVGGGRAGIGKSAFMRSWGGRDVVAVRFPDRQERDYIVLGRVDGQSIIADTASFVYTVARLKKKIAA